MKGSHGHKSVSILELKDHGIRGGGPAADNLPADGKTEDQRGNKTHQDIRACLLEVMREGERRGCQCALSAYRVNIPQSLRHYLRPARHLLPRASHVAVVVKNLPANAGDIRYMSSILGQEDPLEKGMATHSSVLAWRIPWA